MVIKRGHYQLSVTTSRSRGGVGGEEKGYSCSEPYSPFRVFPPLQRVLFCSTYTLLSVSPSFQHDHSTHWTYSPSRVCSGCKTFTCILFSRIGFSSTWVFASLWSPWKERVFLPLESELETEQFVDAESASVSQHPTRCHADPTS